MLAYSQSLVAFYSNFLQVASKKQCYIFLDSKQYFSLLRIKAKIIYF